MPKFFIMGDRQMMYLTVSIIEHPDFGGFIDDSAATFDYMQKSRSSVSSKTISFKNFLRFSKIHSAILVCYYNELVGAVVLAQHLSELSTSFNFKVLNFYEFVVEYDFKLLYEGAQFHRSATLAQADAWRVMAAKLSDDFSRSSVGAYLRALEMMSMSEMLPFVTPFEFEGFNKHSRHFSFVPGDDEIYVDVGAFDGDTVAKFIEATPSGNYRRIHAFEPSTQSYQKLKAKAEWIPRLDTYQLALSDRNGAIDFLTEGSSMGARFASGTEGPEVSKVSVNAARLDFVVDEATFVKVDVEGFECDVVNGGRDLIKRCTPDLVIDTYHYANDALKVYETVMSLHEYQYVSMRFPHAHLHAHSLYFSDRQCLD